MVEQFKFASFNKKSYIYIMIGTRKTEEPMVALIDADSLLYFSSYGSEEDQLLSETKLSEKIYDILNIIEQNYNLEEYRIFVKGKNNFRYKIYPQYKGKRPQKHPIIDVLNQYLVENFGAIESHNAESDDYAFSYSQHPKFKGRTIICSVDKDMLQIPGLHYDYQKNKFINISEEEGNYNLAIQMIMGDSADNVVGLKGYGPVKAKKLISIGMSRYQMIRIIYKEYLKNCESPEKAKELLRLNYKLLKLHKMDIESIISEQINS
jgi:5'-3' exonuclease